MGAMAIVAVAVLVGSVPAVALPKATFHDLNHHHASMSTPTAQELDDPGETAGTIAVSVLPGSLTVSTAQTTLTLKRMPGNGHTTRYRGMLPSVRVIDTRSSLIGWNVTARFFPPSAAAAADLRLRVHPGKPVVVSGQRAGVHSAAPAWTTFETPLSLFGGDQGFGAGTYDDDALIELVLPFATDLTSIALEYEISVS